MAQILLHGTLHATIFEAESLSNPHRASGGAPKFIRKESRRSYFVLVGEGPRGKWRLARREAAGCLGVGHVTARCHNHQISPSIMSNRGPIPLPPTPLHYPTNTSPRETVPPSARFLSFRPTRSPKSQLEPTGRGRSVRGRGACVMGTRGGGGSASRVGDWDVDLGDRWDWGSIPRFFSSACLFFCFGGCFSCCGKTVKKLGELSKTLITHDQLTVGEPFWSTTTIDVSQTDLKGIPPMDTVPWNPDQDDHQHESGKLLLSGSRSSPMPMPPEAGSSHRLHESVNHGRILWEQTREEWTEIKRLRPKVKQVREPVLSWNSAFQTVLVTNKPFPRPVPLHEVVDFLADMWDEAGLYD